MYQAFAGKNVLLLQGPVGPFFRRLAADLENAGANVSKVNLNAADSVFYFGKPALAFRGRAEQWPVFLKQVLSEQAIDVVLLFGDGRPYHRRACEIAKEMDIAVFAFEEGYLRPDYITMEADGVNGRSTMARDTATYRQVNGVQLESPQHVARSFGGLAFYSFFNAALVTFLWWLYPHYRHHRDLNAFRQAYYWTRSAWRYLRYKIRDRHLLELLQNRWHKQFFVLPLQVHNDSQWQHSNFPGSEMLIRTVVESFAKNAAADHVLVIKHHPLDRAYRDYSKLTRALRKQHALDGRLFYVHDLHLPTLLRNARGTVVMNSTVGLSSIFHNTPVKVLGKAIYDLPGLTFQGGLDQFWTDPGCIDRQFYNQFQLWLRLNNQANGSFYRRLPNTDNQVGVVWFQNPPQRHSAPHHEA